MSERKPRIFKDHCDDELPWACCYEDEESNVEWNEGRFYIGFGKTAIEAYDDWKNKKLQNTLQTVVKSNAWFMTCSTGKPYHEVLDYLASITPLTAEQCTAKYLGDD